MGILRCAPRKRAKNLKAGQNVDRVGILRALIQKRNSLRCISRADCICFGCWARNRAAGDTQRGKSLQFRMSVRLAGVRGDAEGLAQSLPVEEKVIFEMVEGQLSRDAASIDGLNHVRGQSGQFQ